MLLELAGVSKRVGAVIAADAIDLRVAEGEALGIIGANGAGKSSLFILVTGVLRPASGTVRLDGRDVTREPVRRRCSAGIGRTFQIPRPFESLSVFENLLVAAQFGGGFGGSVDYCAEVLERTGLLGKADVVAGTLTPTSGEVEVHGRIAALLELGSGFDPNFTGVENVFLNGSILGLSDREISSRFDEIADFVVLLLSDRSGVVTGSVVDWDQHVPGASD